ncbi:type IV pilin protein [Neisseria weixii]|uniref:type IV pilin protein n=1 Tax=Neisseria weixii TaxID=1853276 RepID=UPI000BB6EA2A|nr:type IV pilin protein [Neisseria weixii]ATD65514.1 type IV pilin protein [Neisseria weixii]
MKTRQSGFNLIELLIVIVILALLATIAMPSFQSFIRSTRLANVRSELAENAKNLERYYTQKGTFIGFDESNLVQNEYFNITFMRAQTLAASVLPTNPATPALSSNNQNPSDSGFILQAAPTSDYAQTESCTVFLNDSGIFWAVGNDGKTCPGYEEAH